MPRKQLGNVTVLMNTTRVVFKRMHFYYLMLSFALLRKLSPDIVILSADASELRVAGLLRARHVSIVDTVCIRADAMESYGRSAICWIPAPP